MILYSVRKWLQNYRHFRRALRFNSEFTFITKDANWMCPSCGRIHLSTGTGKFAGPLFPACCNFKAGGRIGREFATPIK